MSPPRCPTCHQPLPPLPAVCQCGHEELSHHITDTGKVTHCCTGAQAGPCPCKSYVQAVAGGYPGDHVTHRLRLTAGRSHIAVAVECAAPPGAACRPGGGACTAAARFDGDAADLLPSREGTPLYDGMPVTVHHERRDEDRSWWWWEPATTVHTRPEGEC